MDPRSLKITTGGSAMNIVLFQPEIPQNTGNIARLCAVTGSTLHLIRPLGFSVDDKHLKRAGLDYWHLLDIRMYDSLEELRNKYSENTFYYITKKAKKNYAQVSYGRDDFLVFGRETKGLPQEVLEENWEFCLRIPMIEDKNARSLNLSTSVGIVAYELLRQNSFTGLC
jgi:tRNA (cytidine/uridine-2'-O-)-methyltransferase